MFGKIKEIKDVVKTEIGLTCMKKGGDNPYSGLCSIGWMCSCIDDEIDSLDALHHLMNKKDGAAVDPSLDEKITNAQKVIAFLSEDGYGQDDICRIGIICNSLERENGDIDIVMKKCNADEQAIEAAIAAINKYRVSLGLSEKWVSDIGTEAIAPGVKEKGAPFVSKDKNDNYEKQKGTVDEKYYQDMMREISNHKDFGKRNPVDIGIECGYSEDEVLQMLQQLAENN